MVRPDIAAQPFYAFTPYDCPTKLDQNEAPTDLPEALRARVLARLQDVAFHRYPDLHADRLRDAIAQWHGWPGAGVVVSNGSNVLIQALVMACGIGQRVLTVTPTFSLYAQQARLLGASLTELPLKEDFSLPLPELLKELERGPGILFLASPAAPTGNLVPEADLRTLVQAAEGWTVVIDEAYCQFAGTDASKLVLAHDNVASLRTFSKAFGLAGARLGYLLAHEHLAQNLQKVLLPFCVSALQLAVGLSVLERPDYISERVERTLRERERVRGALEGMGARVFPSHTNFLLVRVPDAGGVYGALKARGVLLRRQDGLAGLAGCLRVSIGTPAENDAFLAAMHEVMNEVVNGAVNEVVNGAVSEAGEASEEAPGEEAAREASRG